MEVKKKIRVTLNCSVFITCHFPLQLCEIRLACEIYTYNNRNGILIRKSMFIARIMALLTKEKNTTEIYCGPPSMRNLFLYGPNQGSLCTTNILFPTHPAWTLLYIYLSNQRVKLSHSVSGSKINRKISHTERNQLTIQCECKVSAF